MAVNMITSDEHSTTISFTGAHLDHSKVYMDGTVTVNELNKSIENWMQLRHDVDIVFDARFALQSLEQVGLLKSQKLGTVSIVNYMLFFCVSCFFFKKC